MVGVLYVLELFPVKYTKETYSNKNYEKYENLNATYVIGTNDF